MLPFWANEDAKNCPCRRSTFSSACGLAAMKSPTCGGPAFAGIGPAFFDYLAAFRFSGDVLAMPEGTLCFPEEPLLRV